MKNKMAIRSHCLKLYFVTIVIIKCGRKVIWLWFLLYVSVSIFARVVDVRSAAVVGADAYCGADAIDDADENGQGRVAAAAGFQRRAWRC